MAIAWDLKDFLQISLWNWYETLASKIRETYNFAVVFDEEL